MEAHFLPTGVLTFPEDTQDIRNLFENSQDFRHLFSLPCSPVKNEKQGITKSRLMKDLRQPGNEHALDKFMVKQLDKKANKRTRKRKPQSTPVLLIPSENNSALITVDQNMMKQLIGGEPTKKPMRTRRKQTQKVLQDKAMQITPKVPLTNHKDGFQEVDVIEIRGNNSSLDNMVECSICKVKFESSLRLNIHSRIHRKCINNGRRLSPGKYHGLTSPVKLHSRDITPSQTPSRRQCFISNPVSRGGNSEHGSHNNTPTNLDAKGDNHLKGGNKVEHSTTHVFPNLTRCREVGGTCMSPNVQQNINTELQSDIQSLHGGIKRSVMDDGHSDIKSKIQGPINVYSSTVQASSSKSAQLNQNHRGNTIIVQADVHATHSGQCDLTKSNNQSDHPFLDKQADWLMLNSQPEQAKTSNPDANSSSSPNRQNAENSSVDRRKSDKTPSSLSELEYGALLTLHKLSCQSSKLIKRKSRKTRNDGQQEACVSLTSETIDQSRSCEANDKPSHNGSDHFGDTTQPKGSHFIEDKFIQKKSTGGEITINLDDDSRDSKCNKDLREETSSVTDPCGEPPCVQMVQFVHKLEQFYKERIDKMMQNNETGEITMNNVKTISHSYLDDLSFSNDSSDFSAANSSVDNSITNDLHYRGRTNKSSDHSETNNRSKISDSSNHTCRKPKDLCDQHKTNDSSNHGKTNNSSEISLTNGSNDCSMTNNHSKTTDSSDHGKTSDSSNHRKPNNLCDQHKINDLSNHGMNNSYVCNKANGTANDSLDMGLSSQERKCQKMSGTSLSVTPLRSKVRTSSHELSRVNCPITTSTITHPVVTSSIFYPISTAGVTVTVATKSAPSVASNSVFALTVSSSVMSTEISDQMKENAFTSLKDAVRNKDNGTINLECVRGDLQEIDEYCSRTSTYSRNMSMFESWKNNKTCNTGNVDSDDLEEGQGHDLSAGNHDSNVILIHNESNENNKCGKEGPGGSHGDHLIGVKTAFDNGIQSKKQNNPSVASLSSRVAIVQTQNVEVIGSETSISDKSNKKSSQNKTEILNTNLSKLHLQKKSYDEIEPCSEGDQLESCNEAGEPLENGDVCYYTETDIFTDGSLDQSPRKTSSEHNEAFSKYRFTQNEDSFVVAGPSHNCSMLEENSNFTNLDNAKLDEKSASHGENSLLASHLHHVQIVDEKGDNSPCSDFVARGSNSRSSGASSRGGNSGKLTIIKDLFGKMKSGNNTNIYGQIMKLPIEKRLYSDIDVSSADDDSRMTASNKGLVCSRTCSYEENIERIRIQKHVLNRKKKITKLKLRKNKDKEKDSCTKVKAKGKNNRKDCDTKTGMNLRSSEKSAKRSPKKSGQCDESTVASGSKTTSTKTRLRTKSGKKERGVNMGPSDSSNNSQLIRRSGDLETIKKSSSNYKEVRKTSRKRKMSINCDDAMPKKLQVIEANSEDGLKTIRKKISGKDDLCGKNLKLQAPTIQDANSVHPSGINNEVSSHSSSGCPPLTTIDYSTRKPADKLTENKSSPSKTWNNLRSLCCDKDTTNMNEVNSKQNDHLARNLTSEKHNGKETVNVLSEENLLGDKRSDMSTLPVKNVDCFASTPNGKSPAQQSNVKRKGTKLTVKLFDIKLVMERMSRVTKSTKSLKLTKSENKIKTTKTNKLVRSLKSKFKSKSRYDKVQSLSPVVNLSDVNMKCDTSKALENAATQNHLAEQSPINNKQEPSGQCSKKNKSVNQSPEKSNAMKSKGTNLEKLGVSSSPTKLDLRSSPRKLSVKSAPREQDLRSSPWKHDVRSSPKKQDVRSSPRKHVRSSPRKQDVRSSPRKQDVRSSPRKHDVRSSPRKQDVRSSPRKQDVRSSPRKHDVRSSLRKQDVRSSPRKQDVRSSPRKHDVRSSPRKQDVRSSPRKHDVRSSPRKQDVRSSPKKGMNTSDRSSLSDVNSPGRVKNNNAVKNNNSADRNATPEIRSSNDKNSPQKMNVNSKSPVRRSPRKKLTNKTPNAISKSTDKNAKQLENSSLKSAHKRNPGRKRDLNLGITPRTEGKQRKKKVKISPEKRVQEFSRNEVQNFKTPEKILELNDSSQDGELQVHLTPKKRWTALFQNEATDTVVSSEEDAHQIIQDHLVHHEHQEDLCSKKDNSSELTSKSVQYATSQNENQSDTVSESVESLDDQSWSDMCFSCARFLQYNQIRNCSRTLTYEKHRELHQL